MSAHTPVIPAQAGIQRKPIMSAPTRHFRSIRHSRASGIQRKPIMSAPTRHFRSIRHSRASGNPALVAYGGLKNDWHAVRPSSCLVKQVLCGDLPIQLANRFRDSTLALRAAVLKNGIRPLATAVRVAVE
jgi:hypothetical protein